MATDTHKLSPEDLARVARLCVETCLAVKPDEQFLVVADDVNSDEATALSHAARNAGCDPVTIRIPPRDRYAKEPQPAVVAAMAASQVVVLALDHEVSVPFFHSVGTRSAIEAGARIGLYWTTPDTAHVTAADVYELQRQSEQLAALLRAASEVRVTTAAGTDVRVPIAGRRVFAFSSLVDRPGRNCTIPYFGEAAVAPVEGGTEGTIVVDAYMHWLGKIEQPMTLRVERGHVVEVTGGAQAQRLREIITGADANATNIAELGIGSGRIGQLRGISQDKAILGTAHLAIGHNHSLGGSIISNIHLDGVFRDATIELDGRLVMRGGQLVA